MTPWSERLGALDALFLDLEDRSSHMHVGALTLFEADLRGDMLGRLSASRDLMRMSPASADVALLVAVSASYLNRAQEAHDVLLAANPELGINQVSPMYWAWRAASEHALTRYDEELASARQEPAHVQAVEIEGAGAGGRDRDAMPGLAQAESEGARGPAGAAGAGWVHLAQQQDPHRAILRSTPSSCSQWRAHE